MERTDTLLPTKGNQEGGGSNEETSQSLRAQSQLRGEEPGNQKRGS